VAACYAAILAVAAVDWLYWRFDFPCPLEQVTSGACPAAKFDWYSRYANVLGVVGAGIAAIFVVVGCVWVAPKRKALTAVAVFFVGTLAAAVIGWQLHVYPAAILAILAGAVTAFLLYRRHGVVAVA